MPTFLRILAILCVAALVCAGISLVVNHTTLMADAGGHAGAPPSLSSATGQLSGQFPSRAEGGDDHGASLAAGLPGVLTSLAKVSGITLLIVLAQKGLGLLSAQRAVVASR